MFTGSTSRPTRQPLIKTQLLAIVAIALFVSAPVWGEPGDGWRLYDTKDGIRVYIRPSLQDSSIKEYRAETTLDADVPTVVNVIRSLDRQPEWVFRLESARLLERVTDNVVLIHSKYRIEEQLFGLPKHRDVIIRSVLSENLATGEVRFDAQVVKHPLPVDEGYERISQGRASWSLCPVGGGKVQVVTQAYMQLGGLLSYLDFDALVAEGPIHTLNGLKEEVAAELSNGESPVGARSTRAVCNNFLGR